MNPADAGNKSALICSKILNMKEYTESENVFCYRSIQNEVCVDAVIAHALDSGKNVFLPRVEGRNISFIKIEKDSSYNNGSFGIKEPAGDEEFKGSRGFMIVPGIAFDEKKHRIGFGAGYYDKYLTDKPNLFKAAAAYEFQIADSILSDEHDIDMDIIITEDRIIGG